MGIDGKGRLMKHWKKKASGWVFLSHASDDYEEVKIVRNYLEENGFSALMFYLRCLEEKDKRGKIKELLEWEINARNIFVLCESKAANESDWVKWEIELVKKESSKIFKTIDIDNLKYKKCTELSRLDDLMNRATLYFLFSSKDNKHKQIQTIYEKLNSLGFKILRDIPSTTKQGKNINSKIKDAIEETKNKGAVLVFLSKNVLDSKWFWQEKSIVLNENVFIIPIILDDVDITDFPAFVNKEYIDIKNIKDKNLVDEVIRLINIRH